MPRTAPKPPTAPGRRTSAGPDRPSGPDDLSPDEFSAAVSAVTTAFGDTTRREIYLFVRERTRSGDGATSTEIAAQFGLHANVARHHLDKLAAGGYLTVDLARSESAGRPSKRYRAAATDNTLTFPPRRDALIGMLLARAIERLDPDDARAMAEEVGFEYGKHLAADMSPAEGHRSVRTAMAAVADALTAHGFAAHAEAEGDQLTIVNEHCAFGAAAQEYPHVLCAVDRGMIRGLLFGLYGETNPHFVERRPEGADRCVAQVS